MSRLSEGQLAGRADKMGSEGFFHRPPSSAVSSGCFGAYQPSSFEAFHSSDVCNGFFFGTEKGHLEEFQFPYVWFSLVLQSVRAVLVFRGHGALTFQLVWQRNQGANSRRRVLQWYSVRQKKNEIIRERHPAVKELLE